MTNFNHLTHQANLARVDELRDRADRWRQAHPDRSVATGTRTHVPAEQSIAIRRATEADHSVLASLAALEGVRLRSGDMLIAEVQDEPRAAIHIASGATIADPFRPTADLIELLTLRAVRLSSGTVLQRRLRLLWRLRSRSA
jgi:hypothetical protein